MWKIGINLSPLLLAQVDWKKLNGVESRSIFIYFTVTQRYSATQLRTGIRISPSVTCSHYSDL